MTQSSVYDDENMLPPPTDPFLALPHFAGAITSDETDFKPLVSSGRIAALPQATVTSVTSAGAEVRDNDGLKTVRCGAIIAATGYEGLLFDFIDLKVRRKVGLEKVSPPAGCEARVRALRRKWKTVEGDEVHVADQALVYRGMLPAGRWKQRDLAVTGSTRGECSPGLVWSY